MSDFEKAARHALGALLRAGLGGTIQINQKAIDSAVGILRAALKKAEPVHNLVSDAEYFRLFEEARNGSDRPAGVLRGIRAVIAAYEDATPKQAEPVGWMVYTEDGQSVYVTDNPSDIKPSQRALPLFTTAQQVEKKHVFNQAEGGYSNGKPAPTDQRVSGVVAGRDRCDERDQGERGRTVRNGGEVALTGRTRPAMDQHRSDGSSAGADGAHAGSGKTDNILKQQAEPVAEPVAWRYKGEPWFDGNRWHDKYDVTTDERVAKFKDKDAQPLYTAQQAEPVAVQAEPVDRWLTDDLPQVDKEQAEPVARMVRMADGTIECVAIVQNPAQQAEPVAVQAEPVASRAQEQTTDDKAPSRAVQAKQVTSRPKERDFVSHVGYTRALEAYCDSLVQAEPVVEPVNIKALAAKAGLPLAWISETGVIQWSQLERLVALAFPLHSSAQQAEPVGRLRDLLINTAATAVDAERQGRYPGAARVADWLLEEHPQQAEPVQPEQKFAGAFNDGVLEGALREREIWLQQLDQQAEPVAEPVVDSGNASF